MLILVAEDTEAVAHAQVHTQLARLARQMKAFSVNYVWAVYARTGSVSRTGEILAAMERAVRGVEEEGAFRTVEGIECEKTTSSGMFDPDFM